MYFVYETAEDYKNITLPFLEKQQLKIEVWLSLHGRMCCFAFFVLIVTVHDIHKNLVISEFLRVLE